MKKLYYAHIAANMVDYFEECVKNHMHGDVEIVERDLKFDSDWNPVYYYVLRAKEGIINPTFEICKAEV